MNRVRLAALLAVLFTLASRARVTIWLSGYPVARPPVAGLLVAALGITAAGLLALTWRRCRGFRSSPHPRPAWQGRYA